MREYRDLIVWQEGIELVKLIYQLVKSLPAEERYGLSDQMRRAAVSIPSNVAEGHDRHSDRELSHFLAIAKGSAAELDTQLFICKELGYLPPREADRAMQLCAKIRARLYNFMASVAE